jgi:hypothetical protein
LPPVDPSTALIVSMVSNLISVALAIFVAWRNRAWRDIDARVKSAEKMEGRVDNLETEVVALAAQMQGVPRLSDFEALKSDLRAFARDIHKVEAGVKRIEDFLLEGAKR